MGTTGSMPPRRRSRCPARVRRKVTARRAAFEHRRRVASATSFLSSAVAAGRHRSLNTVSSLRPNNSGSTRFTITAASSTEVSVATFPANSMVSLTGISSGVVTITRPVVAGSERISRIQSVCERISPTLTRSLMAWGAASCPTMCPVADASTTTRS